MIAVPVDRRQQVFRNFSRLLKNRADQIRSHFRRTRHGSKHLVGPENLRHQKLHVAEWRAIGVHIIAPAQAGWFVESAGLPNLTDRTALFRCDYRRSCLHRQCRLTGFSAFFGNTVSTFCAQRREVAANRNTERLADPPGQTDSSGVSGMRAGNLQ